MHQEIASRQRMKYHFRISETSDGRFLLQCVEMYFCTKVISRREDAAQAAYRKIHDHLGEPSTEILFASPCNETLDQIKEKYSYDAFDVIAIPVEPATAFAITLRRLRSNRGLSQEDITRKLGLKSRSIYQQLEDSKRSNPTLESIVRLQKILPKLNFASLFEPPDSYLPFASRAQPLKPRRARGKSVKVDR